MLDEKIKGTHADDFHEHMGFRPAMAGWAGGKDPGHFTHHYYAHKSKHDPEDSVDTFHGIMAYHGYKEVPSKDSIKYEGEDEHRKHEFHAKTNKHGHVMSIRHHERWKNVTKKDVGFHEETKVFGKTLRSIVPKKSQLSTANTVLDTPAAPQTRADNKKLLGLRDIVKIPDGNGNPDGFATAKSPPRKEKAPGVGYMDPLKGIKEEEELDEISKGMAGRYAKKAVGSLSTAAHNVGYGDPDEKSGTWERKAENREKGLGRAVKRLTKEEAELDEAERSKNYQFTTDANSEDGKKRINRLKDAVHAFAKGTHRVNVHGRLGKDNPAAQKYKDKREAQKKSSVPWGAGAYQRIDPKDAVKHDVYVGRRNEEVEHVVEISSDKAAEYVKGASYDYKGLKKGDGGPTGSDRIHNQKRRNGIAMAVDKMAGKSHIKVPTKG